MRGPIGAGLTAVMLALAVAGTAMSAEGDFPVPIQLQSIAIPLVNKVGGRTAGPVTVFIEVAEEGQVEIACRMMPRIKDAMNVALNLHPVVFSSGRYELEGIDELLIQAINSVVKDDLIRAVHMVPGIRRMGEGTKVLDKVAGSRRDCRPIEDYPPGIGIAQLRVVPEEPKTVKEVIAKKDWFKPAEPPPPPAPAKPVPKTIHRYAKWKDDEDAFGLWFWIGVAGAVVVLGAVGGGVVMLLTRKPKKGGDRRTDKERRDTGERRKKDDTDFSGPERRSDKKRRTDAERRSSDRRADDRRGGDRRAKSDRRS